MQARVIINLVTIARFYQATYAGIFKYLLAARSTDGKLLGPVLTYFSIVKINK